MAEGAQPALCATAAPVGLKTGPIVRTIAPYQPLFEPPVPPNDHDRLPKLQSKGFHP